LANDEISFQGERLVALEIRYHAPDATNVVLVWGINDWASLPEGARPPGTTLHEGLMHTPMELQDDTFVLGIQVPAYTTVDYGFLVT
jgi:hypothetical protein